MSDRRTTTTAVLVTACTALGLALQANSGNHKQENAPDLTSFHLSMDKLSKAAQASKVLEKLSEADPSFKGVAQFDKHKGPQAVAEGVSRIDDHPQARTAVVDTGISTRDYVLTMYCHEQSTEALFLKNDARQKHYAPGTSEENVRFVKRHLKQINRLFSDKP